MSVDFSNEPIGKPRWCITRGGEIRLAWNWESEPNYPITSVSISCNWESHTVNGLTWEDDENAEDLVSFAPPECDSFTWKAPEPINVGDWVEITVYERGAKVGEKVQVVHVGQSLIQYTHPSTTHRLGASIGCYRKCDPPTPRYRPFASAEEFDKHSNRWLRWAADPGLRFRAAAYDDYSLWATPAAIGRKWESVLSQIVFADTNEPCGVKVDA